MTPSSARLCDEARGPSLIFSNIWAAALRAVLLFDGWCMHYR